MDSINCSWNYHFFFLFLHVFQIRIITSPSPVSLQHDNAFVFYTALHWVGSICKEFPFLFWSRAECWVQCKSPQSTSCHNSNFFFFRDAIILGCICCFLWQPNVPSLQIDGSKIDLYYGLFIRLTWKDLQHYILLPHWLLMGTIKEGLNSTYPFYFLMALALFTKLTCRF